MDTGLHSLKSAFKIVVHNAGEIFGCKIADAVTKSNNDEVVNESKN